MGNNYIKTLTQGPVMHSRRGSRDELKVAMHEASASSFESALGDQGVASLESAQMTIGRIFEGPEFRPEAAKCPTGIAMAAFVMTLGDKSREYMEGYSVESSVGAARSLAFSQDAGFESVYSPESFDNQQLGKYRDMSIELNYNIGRQNDAMELMYRSVAIGQDQGGISLDIPNLYVQNVLERDMSGAPTDFGYRRALDAYIDSTILADDGVQLIPMYTDKTAENFVDLADAPLFPVTQGNRTVMTTYLKTGRDIDIVAIGTLDRVDRVGDPDFSDALDRSCGIQSLLHKIGNNRLNWTVKGQPYTRYVPGTEHGTRRMIMDYINRSMTIDANSVDIEGQPLAGAWFDLIKTNEYRVRLKMTAAGAVDVAHGVVSITMTSMSVHSIEDKHGELVALTDASVKPIVEAILSSTIPGWMVDGRLTNSNLRNIGMLIAHRTTKEILVTRTRSPFYYAFPSNEERDTTPAEDMASVVRAYTNNEGIAHMIGFHERAMAQTGGVRGLMTKGNFEDNHLTVEGVARSLLNPYIETVKINVYDGTQSLETMKNLANAKEMILNRLRSVAFDILQTTNIENACRILDGGEIKYKPEFALITSKKIESFLTVSGDSRTLGAGLDYEIRSDVNSQLDGVIYMGIVRKTPGNEIDILSNGVCLQTPTMVTEVTSWRNNRQVKELLVQPRFNHYQLNPIMVRFELEGVDELLEQLNPFRTAGSLVSDAGAGGTQPDPVDPNAPVAPGQGGSGAGTNP